jgi:hypothetical protein
MSSATRIIIISVAALATLPWTRLVIAAEPSASSSVPDVVETVSPVPVATEPSSTVAPVAAVRRNPFNGKPMAPDALAAKRGGDGVFNDQQLKGMVANNSASNLTTGTNVISEGAFSNSAGMSTVIQNSGNNVLIQNATIVNVQVK